MNPICYQCGSPANSREHVPPLCLFPETKDVKGINLRKDLITVPSCEIHNSKKSTDDEFLMISIAGIVGNNFIGFIHNHTKVTRAIRRKSSRFLGSVILKKNKSFFFKNDTKKNFPITQGIPDVQRLIKCFEHIAYGLYFHKFQKIFDGEVKVLLGFILYDDDNSQTLVDFIKEKFAIEELALQIEGVNKEVFTYQFSKEDEHGIVGLKLVFYEGADVFIAFVPNNVNTTNLGVELVKQGIKTVFTLGDKEFVFNKDN